MDSYIYKVFKGFNIDILTYARIDNFFINEVDSVLFFNTDDNDNKNISGFINDNYTHLIELFSKYDRCFIDYSRLNSFKDIETLVHYYAPQFRSINFSNQKKKSPNTYLEAIKYTGDIKAGFIVFEQSSVYIIECNDKEFYSLEPFTKFEKYFIDLAEFIFVSRRKVGPETHNPYEGLDDVTIKKIIEIKSRLKEIKKNGKFLLALPLLSEILEDQYNNIDIESISKLQIDSDYSITLPYFNNLEIPLSHLTKVVYILFYNNPSGIDIKELHLYKEEIKKLYLSISNQLDYDKMMLSIDDLINSSSKGIYTHISRIKSAFYSVIDKKYADNYIIVGEYHGSTLKFIPIQRPLEDIDLYTPEF